MNKLKLKKPALLLDKEKCLENIAFMAEKAKNHNLLLRPHFKTHQSAEIGEYFREHGTKKITVSSISMADYFAKNGWKDICVAFPFNIHEIDDARRLAKKIKLHLTVCSAETTRFIEQSASKETGIYIKTDTGYHRTGVYYDNTGEIDKILKIIENSKNLVFSGFLVHNGHTYQSPDTASINQIHQQSNARLVDLKKRYIDRFPNLILSTGDTPSCSISENFTGIDEIRPGNYVFYDLSQCYIGSCTPSKVAVALAVPVVARHMERKEIVVFGGAVHLSKEYIILKDGMKVWGQVVELLPDGRWSEPIPGSYVIKVSQEHGVIKCNDFFFKKTKTGDFLGILPVHSCLTANLMKGYKTIEGKEIVHFSGCHPA